jgi:hypothetical protein
VYRVVAGGGDVTIVVVDSFWALRNWPWTNRYTQTSLKQLCLNAFAIEPQAHW